MTETTSASNGLPVSIWDANGYQWKWNGERVYMELAEQEMILHGQDTQQNGYPASTLEEALNVLFDGGYMTDPSEDNQ